MQTSSFLTVLMLALASGTHAAGPSSVPTNTLKNVAISASTSSSNSATATATKAEEVLDRSGKIIPCAKGSGTDNGCGSCANSSGITLTPWNQATKKEDFSLKGAEAAAGTGWDVFWNVGKMDAGCRAILTVPSAQEKGSTSPGVSGNVVLSVSQPGCYFANVRSVVSASYCCGTGDCSKAGAQPAIQKREMTTRVKRAWGRPADHSSAVAPAKPTPAVTCDKAKPSGEPYYKSGAQQLDNNFLYCNGGQPCSLSPSMTVSVSNSYTNDRSTTLTTSQGLTYSVSAGMQWGVMGSGGNVGFSFGGSNDWSKAVAESFSETKDKSVSKTMTFTVNVVPGNRYNLWFTPTMKCQAYTFKCNDAEQVIERCEPTTDTTGNPQGEYGIVTVG